MKGSDSETKHERFQRLAETRTERSLKEIRKIGNLANPTRYEYSTGEVREIIGALKTEVAAVETAFKRPEERRFTLKRR